MPLIVNGQRKSRRFQLKIGARIPAVVPNGARVRIHEAMTSPVTAFGIPSTARKGLLMYYGAADIFAAAKHKWANHHGEKLNRDSSTI